MKKAIDVITGQVLRTVSPDELIIVALHKMEEMRISSLLVFEAKKFVGIVTMVDIAMAYNGQRGDKVGDIMTKAKDVVSVGSDVSLETCSQIMHDNKRHFHHLVIKNDRDEVVGVLSTWDLSGS